MSSFFLNFVMVWSKGSVGDPEAATDESRRARWRAGSSVTEAVG